MKTEKSESRSEGWTVKGKKESMGNQESFFAALDSIAERRYPGYYTAVRDPKEPLTIKGVAPDIVAGDSPRLVEDDIKIVAMVGTEESLAFGLPKEWAQILELSRNAKWMVDFFVPKSMMRNVRNWLKGKDIDVRIIPL